MLIRILCVLFLLVAGCSSPPQVADDASADRGESGSKGANYAQVLREQGYRRYLAGEFTRAIQHFESYVILEPESEDAWVRYLLYYCYMAVGEYEQALKLAKELVKEKPYDFLSYQQVGLAQLWLGRVDDALVNFQRSLEFESHLPQASFYQGLALGKLRQFKRQEKAFQDAENDYRQILTANPTDFRANYELASLYLYWNREIDRVPTLTQTAKQSLLSRKADEDVLREESLYLNFYIPLLEGVYLYRVGKFQKSLHQLLAALVNAPLGIRADMAELYHYLGLNYLALNETTRAQAFLERADRLDPTGMYAEVTKKTLRSLATQKPR